jgi:hypothetical protein
MREMRRAFKSLVGEPEGKKPLGRPRRRWKDIKINIRGTELEGVDWIHLAQGTGPWRALVNRVMNIRASEKAGNFLTS